MENGLIVVQEFLKPIETKQVVPGNSAHGAVAAKPSALDRTNRPVEGKSKAPQQLDDRANKNDGIVSFHTAAKRGLAETVQTLLDQGVDIEVKDTTGWTVLCIAAMEGHHETVQVLLNGEAEIAAKAYNEWTALHVAVIECRPRIIQELLDRGAEINAKDDEGKTALAMAVENGQRDIVDQLMNNGARPSLRQRARHTQVRKRTPIHRIFISSSTYSDISWTFRLLFRGCLHRDGVVQALYSKFKVCM